MSDYVKLFSSIGLSSITNTGKFKTDLGLKTLSEMLLSYGMQANIPLAKDSGELLMREAREYCIHLEKDRIREEQDRKSREKEEKNRLKYEKLYRSNVSKNFDLEELEAHREYIKRMMPFVDVRDAKIHFYDDQSRSTVKIEEEFFMAVKDIPSKRELLQGSYFGHTEFNPLAVEPHYYKNEHGTQIKVLNLCKTPTWIGKIPSDKEIHKSLIFRLIENLLPDIESREFALCWAYHAITSRNHTYLSLVGARGVGKGMFADLIGQLVGRNYFQKCGESILEGNFNKQFENSRVLFFDEMGLDTKEKVNKLKAYANNHISLEGKGKDARTIRNFTSCIMANNSISAMQIGPEERRFSIVTIGKQDLRQVMKQEEIETLVELLERDHEQEPHQEVVDFGHWLLKEYRTPKYSNNYTYKGDYFYEVSQNGLSEWKQFIISWVETEYEDDSIVFFRDLKSKYASSIGADRDKVVFPQPKTMSTFLQEYKYLDKFTLAEVVDGKKNPEDRKICKALKINTELRDYLIQKVKGSEEFIDL